MDYKFRLYINDPVASHSIPNLKCEPSSGPNPIPPLKCDRFTSWINSTGIAFLDAYLRDDQSAKDWLRSSNVEVASQFIADLDRR